MVQHTQFVGKLPTNCMSVFDHFVGFALKGFRSVLTHFMSRSLSIPPENIRKTKGFLMFSGGMEKDQEMG